MHPIATFAMFLSVVPSSWSAASAVVEWPRVVADEAVVRPASRGVVILRLPDWSSLAAAGVKSGDLLLTWSREAKAAGDIPAAGEFRSVYDYYEVLTNQVPRGPIVLTLQRGTRVQEYKIETSEWGARVRPNLPDDLLATYTVAEGQVGCSIDGPWFELGAEAARRRLYQQSAWSYMRIVESCRREKAMLLKALELVVAVGLEIDGGAFYPALRREEAVNLQAAGEFASAQSRLEDSLAWCRRAKTKNLCEEKALVLMGDLQYGLGNFQESMELFKAAVSGYDRAWDSSFHVADARLKLAAALDDLGSRDLARIELIRAFEIRNRDSLRSPGKAKILLDFGRIEFKMGKVVEAKALLASALSIYREISPDNVIVATILLNIAGISKKEGDFQQALEGMKEAVEIDRRAGDKYRLGNALNDYGVLLFDLGDERAEAVHEESLRLRLEYLPGSMWVAQSLGNLGACYFEQERFGEAKLKFFSALEIAREKAPDGIEVANFLNSIAAISYQEGDLKAAERYMLESLARSLAISPVEPLAASAAENLARLYLELKDYKNALEVARRALDIRMKYGGGSIDQATSYYLVARSLVGLGRQEEARQFSEMAYRSSVEQVQRVPNFSSMRAHFRSVARPALGLYVSMLVGESPEKAVSTLEEFRAREFFAVLSSTLNRRKGGRGDAFPTSFLSSGSPIADLEPPWLARSRDGFVEYFEFLDGLIDNRPYYSILPSSEGVVELGSIRDSLGSDEVILSYFIQKEFSFAFAISKSSVVVARLPPEGVLLEKAKELRAILSGRWVSTSIESLRATELSRMLAMFAEIVLSPVLKDLQGYKRVLIVPDGPLNYVPFAALRPVVDGREVYFLEWKALSVLLAPAILPYLLSLRGRTFEASKEVGFLGFGNPGCLSGQCGKSEGSSLDTARLKRRMENYRDDLEGGEQEVEEIAKMFSGMSKIVRLGSQATESELYKYGGRARILHFAGHAFVDDRFPLSSGLVLAKRGPAEATGDGLLQAGEIFGRVGFSADLVVLSACDSALGPNKSGEGVISLTRAFQASGARSVVASLWSVEDGTTAELVIRFYRHLIAGESKIEALRAAQLELVHGDILMLQADGSRSKFDASNPYYWAAFQLYGDWQ